MSTLLRSNTVKLPGLGSFGTGWLPPVLDRRDYTETHPNVAPMVQQLKMPKENKALQTTRRRTQVDLRPWCSPIEDQGQLGACTAHAAIGIIEYFENRAFGEYINGSRLFVYKNTRNLMGVKGDTGAWLRNTMGAMALCGVADERYWPYTDAAPDFDAEPSSFVYSIADNYECLKYFCHDPLGKNVPFEDVLTSVKKYLAAGIPSMFGFTGFQSAFSGDVSGAFPLPGPNEPAQWGHAIVAVGYDDNLVIKNNQYPAVVTTGALLIRNSWGVSFGNQGYGWLPYDYVRKGLAMDFWSLLNMEWIETGQFQFQDDGQASPAAPTTASQAGRAMTPASPAKTGT